MSKTVEIDKLFDIQYGNGFSIGKMQKSDIYDREYANFVARTEKNNGVTGAVKVLDTTKPFKAGSISVALSANVLESFVQPFQFYTSYHIAVLSPKRSMTVEEKIYYCMCIKSNRYKYNYGRQANRTFRSIQIPESPPNWVLSTQCLKENSQFIDRLTSQEKRGSVVSLRSPVTWKEYKYGDLFEIKKGKRITNSQVSRGSTPFIRPLKHSNGYSDFIGKPPNHPGNTITVNYDSEGGVGEAFYQPKPFFAIDSVNILYPKFPLTPNIGMFLVTLIRKEKYRYNYGRKWHLERMSESVIRLPALENGTPDWDYIEKYISSLPYSQGLAEKLS